MMRNKRKVPFEFTPGGPLPKNLSPLAEQVAEIVPSIPAGRWVSWGDLGDALGTTGKAVGLAGLTLSPHPKSTLMPHEWRVPWHRVRMADGSHQPPDFVSNDENWEIIEVTADWWEREGGRWLDRRGGRYDPTQRFPLR